MKELNNFVNFENQRAKITIKSIYGREPLEGELIDLTKLASRRALREYIGMRLEDENLLQDGERSRKEAESDFKMYTKILKQLDQYECQLQNDTSLKGNTAPRRKSAKFTPPAATTFAERRSKKA